MSMNTDSQISDPIPGPTTPTNASKTTTANGDTNALTPIVVAKQINLNKENLDPGLFARERNPRRKATKLFGDVPTPSPPRRPKPTATPASHPQSFVKSAVRPKKRKPQQDYHWPSEKRRRKSKQSNPRYSPQCEAVANITPAMADQNADLVSERSEGNQSPEPLYSMSGLLTPSPEVAEHRPPEPTTVTMLANPQQTDIPELQMTVPVPEDLPKTTFPQRLEPDPPSHLAKVPSPRPIPEHFEASIPFPQAATSELIGFVPHPTVACLSKLLPLPQSSQASSHVAGAAKLEEFDQFPRPEALPAFQHCSKTQIPLVVQDPADPTHDSDSVFETITYNPLKRPARDIDAIINYVEAVKTVLRGQSVVEPCTVATRQAKRILSLLEAGKPPDATDAVFVNSLEAAGYLSSQWDGVIVTEGQQVFPLQTVQEFLGEYYNIRAKVWVQDPSVQIARNLPSVKQATIAQVKKRFATPLRPGDEPWNLLELATHCDDGIRPVFLNNEDCRLLTKLKVPNSAREAKRRAYSPGYKEVEKWALVAQAGALTEPHQDSHGYGTFITLNFGCIGFGWLSRPTDADRAEWCACPATYLGDRWRYVVLKPGQTVYFPAGTVHFVFRLPAAGDSLAFGGHVLRCSNLVRWVQTLLEEKRFPAITNEDITQSAPGYLNQVEKFVKQALQSGDSARMSKWGGRAAIEEFLRLKKEFMGASVDKPKKR